MIPGKLYRYNHLSTTVIIMENRDWLYELQDIKMGNVFFCIETEPAGKELRARLLDSNGDIGWAMYHDIYWEMIS